MDELLTPDMMTGALVLDCKETRSGYFKGDGKGGFVFHPFPSMAQIAPVNAIVLCGCEWGWHFGSRCGG